METARVDTVVVGAGIAGLAYAQARGDEADLVVLDSGSRAGGLVRTGEHQLPDGGRLQFEWGPEALQDSEPEARALFEELHLPPLTAPEDTNNRFVVKDGRLVPLPLSPPAFLKSPLLTLGGKLRALREPWRAPEVALDGSVADFVRHRLGPQVLERLVDPFVTGIYAGDPELISMRAAFPLLHTMVSEHGSLMKGLKARARAAREAEEAGEPRRRRGPPPLITLPGGLGALPTELARRLGERLWLSTQVSAIERDGEDWIVRARTRVGPEGTNEPTAAWRARRLVLATPARVTGELLAGAVPAVGEALADVVSESVIAISHAWRRQDVEHPLDGFGYLIPSIERKLHLGTLFSSTINPGCCPEGLVLMRTLLGGARHGAMIDWPDEQLLDEIREGVGALLGLRGQPIWTGIVRWRAVLPRYDLSHPQRLAAVDEALAQSPGLQILGNHRKGIAVPALIAASRVLARDHAAA
jgi:oxygen-dependent protoporphyrinogen oxidase